MASQHLVTKCSTSDSGQYLSPRLSFVSLLHLLEEAHEREVAAARGNSEATLNTDAITPTPACSSPACSQPLHPSSPWVKTAGDQADWRSESWLSHLPSMETSRGPKESMTLGKLEQSFTLWPQWNVESSSFDNQILLDKTPSQATVSANDIGAAQEQRNGISLLVRPHCPHTIILKPSSRFRLSWDFAGFFILVYDLIWIPMMVFQPPETTWTRVVTWVTILFWTFDVVMTFITGYYNERGVLIKDAKSIAKQYARTWLLLDFAIVGIDWAAIIFAGLSGTQGAGIARVSKVVRAVRMVRTLRLLRLMKLRKLMMSFQELVDSEYVWILLSLVKNALTLLAFNHGIACAWFWLGTSTGSPNWVDYYQVNQVHYVEQYLWAYHWSMTQFTPGSGIVQPQNMTERAFALVVLVFGMLIFSSFVSNNTSALTRLRNLTAHDITQQFLLRKFLKEQKISRDLSARVVRYIDLVKAIHKRKTNSSKVEYLQLLSGPLRVELQRELIEPHIEGHCFFEQYRTASQAAMSQMCFSAASQVRLSKADVLFHSRSHASHMFFLIGGALLYRTMKRVRANAVRRLRVEAGQFFCEAILWVQAWLHRGTMRALVESELISIDGERFREVTLSYPRALVLGCTYAKEFMRNLEDGLDTHGFVWDLPDYRKHRLTQRSKTIRMNFDDLYKAQKSASSRSSEVRQAEELEAHLMDSSESEEEPERHHGEQPKTADSEKEPPHTTVSRFRRMWPTKEHNMRQVQREPTDHFDTLSI